MKTPESGQGWGLAAWITAGAGAGAVLFLGRFFFRSPFNHLPPAALALSAAIGGALLLGWGLRLLEAALIGRSGPPRWTAWLAFPAFAGAGVLAWRQISRLPGLRHWDFGPSPAPGDALWAGAALAAVAAAALLAGFARASSLRWRLAGHLAAVLVPAAALALPEMPSPSGPLPPTAPRAILLITIDTLRADHVSALGYPRATTPGLDALAGEGLLFENAVAAMPSTDPSHAAMLTGYPPRSLGLISNGLAVTRPDTASVAAYLAGRGYRTMAVTSRAGLDPGSMNLTGFHGWDAPSRKLGEISASSTLQRAQRWVDRYGGRPFFLWVHFWDPHAPYDPPEPERSWFVKPDRGMPARPRAQGNAGDPTVPPELLTLARDLYDAEIRHADRHAAALVEHVRRQAGRENTLVVVAADHGESFGEWDLAHRFAFGHGYYLSAHELHVPLVFAWPGKIPAGRRWPHPVSTVAIAPTLAHLIDGGRCGAEEVLPLLGGSASIDPPPAVFSERQQFREPPSARLEAPEFGLTAEGWLMVDNLAAGPALRRWEERGEPISPDQAPAHRAVVERLRGRLRGLLSLHQATAVDQGELSPAEIEALKNLGYIH